MQIDRLQYNYTLYWQFPLCRHTSQREAYIMIPVYEIGLSCEQELTSGVASFDNWRGEYSYICVHRP